MNDYLQHSSKGTSWVKRQHNYEKKVAKRYYYDYEAMLKKLWKYKKNNDPRYEQLKSDYESKKKAKANAHIAKIYNKVADKTGSAEVRKEAEYYQRRSNDAIQKKIKHIKLVDVTSDTINRGKRILSTLLKRKK